MELPGSRQQSFSRPDEGLYVEFYMGSKQDDAESEKQGRPIFRDVPFVRIAIPGNRDEIWDDVAWTDPNHQRSHVSRFPNAWMRFRANQSESTSGTPLKEWAGISRSQVEQLAYFKVKTVEQLAVISDANLQNFPQGLVLRQKAQDFLAQANSAETLRSELDALKAQLLAMQAPKGDVGPAVATATGEAPRRRRGRPPKAKPEEKTHPVANP